MIFVIVLTQIRRNLVFQTCLIPFFCEVALNIDKRTANSAKNAKEDRVID
jgi:hypothetical protein